MQTVATRSLSIASQVAAHPRVIALRERQQVMYRTLLADYGDNFSLTHTDMPHMIMPNGRKALRSEGIHYWTPAQRAAWVKLDIRLKAVRAAVRSVYEAV